ncbi:unnamed protein product [Eruca vesicaria subsp. sativa]|uniref:Ubiquitin-like domain-containing protein n=1 Tax=Eruca vesicaria subsp. sativa TaxID=29727 RepID=A0ABC8JNT7_ERUVS|nr:unnamed protein product [Eruca vesicaria subsp. sativa]
MADQSPKPLQFFVKLLNGKSVTLTFPSPSAYGDQIKQRIFNHTQIPTHLQRLIHGGYQISDGSTVSQSDSTVMNLKYYVMVMERLKTELQSRGLKCGGRLQERAARLFLLKSTPLDMLQKKLLAKK